MSAAQQSNHQGFAPQGFASQGFGQGSAGSAGGGWPAANGVATPVVSEQLLRSLKVSWYLKVGFKPRIFNHESIFSHTCVMVSNMAHSYFQ